MLIMQQVVSAQLLQLWGHVHHIMLYMDADFLSAVGNVYDMITSPPSSDYFFDPKRASTSSQFNSSSFIGDINSTAAMGYSPELVIHQEV